MNLWTGTWATCRFELARSVTLQRMVFATVLALFPPLMVFVLGLGLRILEADNEVSQADVQAVVRFFPLIIIFLVTIVCVLSLLLWATTNVYSDLEGKSWIFLATRPRGRIAVLMGKYFAAVVQAFVIAEVSIVLSILVTARGTFSDPTQFWISLSGVILIACFVYGAILSLIGTLFYRRAMVIGAGYLIAVELLLANIPALVCNLTVRRHLFDLGIRWVGWFFPGEDNMYRIQYGWYPQWVNLAALGAMTVLALLAASHVVQTREYLTADET